MNTLTIGMATYRDFEGVWMTIRTLKTFHPLAYDLIVIDNAPTPCAQTRGVTLAAGGRYMHRPDLAGTSAPRDHLFRVARTPWVMCVDSHVILEPGAVAAAIGYAESHPDSMDLIQGPLVHDDGRVLKTHWAQTTPPGLWGVWKDDLRVKGSEPFEIPMQGLGLWMMRREAWPSFNPMFRGFGGEEGYIHEKTRQRGGRALCLPALRWQHRFREMKSGGPPPPYPLRLEDHVRNLLIGHRELGIDAVEAIHKDFAFRLPEQVWQKCLADAEAQPKGEHRDRPKPLRLLGVWYSNNAAPPKLLRHSLDTIHRAADSSRHAVEVSTCSWAPTPGNPFPWTKADLQAGPAELTAAPDPPHPNARGTLKGHAAILRQISQAQRVATAGHRIGDPPPFDAVVYLEHDVLYPPDYFDRIGDAFAANPDAPVVSNLDYIGLNGTGWLAVKERHEPMHQLSIRWGLDFANRKRAWGEVEQQGWCLLEPQGDRADWVRLPFTGNVPAVHVNHPNRLTTHGEVCYEAVSSLKPQHPFWGDFKPWWPLEATPQAAAPKTAKKSGCSSCGKPPAPAAYPTLEDWFAAAAAKPSDFHEHMGTLRDLADKCESVAEISHWAVKPALLSLVASKAAKVASYCPMDKPEYTQLTKHAGERFRHVVGPFDANTFEPVDMVFIDTKHNAATLYGELAAIREKVRRQIVIHCTLTFGEKGDDGQAGVLPAIRRFLAEHNEWTAVRADQNNHGLMVLSRDEADKRQPPGLMRKALNFSKALAKHAADGNKLVSDDVWQARLDTCLTCEYRHFDTCGACGCPIQKKTSWASEKCGLVNLGMPPKWGAEKEASLQAT